MWIKIQMRWALAFLSLLPSEFPGHGIRWGTVEMPRVLLDETKLEFWLWKMSKIHRIEWEDWTQRETSEDPLKSSAECWSVKACETWIATGKTPLQGLEGTIFKA